METVTKPHAITRHWWLLLAISLLSATSSWAQDWPEVAQSANRPCYLIGNWRGLALKNADVQVFIGKPSEPQNYTPYYNAEGINQWTTDAHGILCLGRQPSIPEGQTLLVVQDDLLGGLLNPAIPVILLNEDIDVDIALSESKEDDLLSVNISGWLPVRVALSESLLAAGEVELLVRSADLLFSNEIDPAGDMVKPEQTIQLTIPPEDPDELFYITPASKDYPFDAEGRYTAQIEIEVYRLGQTPVNGRMAKTYGRDVYATNQTEPIATANETVTLTANYVLYRGANVGAGLLYEQAAQGKVTPKSWGHPAAHASPVRHHSTGTNESIFTSWSLNYNVAAKFAVVPFDIPGAAPSANQGVILTREVPADLIMKSPSSFSSEQEVLQIGPLTADAVAPVRLEDFERNPADVMVESVQDGRVDEIRARLDALPQGMRWQSLPLDQNTCYFIAEETGTLLPGTTIAAWQVAPDGTETPLLHNNQNSWPVNEFGYVCFNTGGLAEGQTIKIEAQYYNNTYQGIATHNYPIVFLNNNPRHIYPVHVLPGNAAKEYRNIKGLKPILFGAKVTNGNRDAQGTAIENPYMPKDEMMGYVQELRLMLDGTVLPINGNIPEDDFDYIPNPYQQNEFYSSFTPPDYGTYVFTPEVTLTNGVVVQDPKPLKVVVVPLPGQAGLTGGIGVIGINGGTGVRTASGSSSLSLGLLAQPANFTFDTARHLNNGQGLAAKSGTIHVPLHTLSSIGTITATGSNPDHTTFELPFHYAYATAGRAGTLTTANRQAFQGNVIATPTALVSYDYPVITAGLPQAAQRVSYVVSGHQQSGDMQGVLQFTYRDTLSQAELNAVTAYRWQQGTATWQAQPGSLVVNANNQTIALPITAGGTYALFTEAPPRNPRLALSLTAGVAQTGGMQLVATPAMGNLPPHYVQFYANGVLVGTDYAAPFELAWQPPAAGQYTFEALPWHSQSPGSPAWATYDYTSQANPCPATNTVTAVAGPALYRSQQLTTASGFTLAAGQALQLQSASKVVLKPGFHARTGSFVQAYLATCNDQPLLRVSESQASTAALPTGQAQPSSYLQTLVYPNPYQGTINITYEVPAPGQLTIQLFSMEGALLKTLARRQLAGPATGTVPLNLEVYPNQLMVLVVQHPTGTQTHKIIRQ